MIDLGVYYQIVRPGTIRIDQDGFKPRNFSAEKLKQALETETDYRRALALQEALDMLEGHTDEKYDPPLCQCLERIGDNGPCPVHGEGLS